jgi:hypothetical protein
LKEKQAIHHVPSFEEEEEEKKTQFQHQHLKMQ